MSKHRDGLIGDGSAQRCWWCGEHAEYVAYHDTEWGFPVADDRRLFEKICLEGFQAGLSWLTILRKRDNFREAFGGFELERVAGLGKRDVTRLLRNAGIVRHRGKIESTVNNARRTIELVESTGSLAAFVWRHEPARASRPPRIDYQTIANLVTTDESKELSKALKARGFSFVGPTTMYAFMQSVGLVNDHLEGCAIRARAESARRRFARPEP